jgi:flavin-dependent dehydrogenase
VIRTDAVDVVVAGGGPSGLAAAIRCAERGFRTLCFERQAAPPDKACGEGLMPAGVRELEALGVAVRGAPFHGIRYVQEDGHTVEGRFAGGDGLGVRRLALSQALLDRARACGVELLHGSVRSAAANDTCVRLDTDQGPVEGRLLVAADGLHSPLRAAAGLSLPAAGPQRFGVRRHFAAKACADCVEVHWADGCEAYVTPIGEGRINVAFLSSTGARFDDLLARFPRVAASLGEPASEARGAGPLLQRVRRRYGRRLALVGDAAGYVDAITGQGLSLAFAAASILARLLPDDLSRDLTPALRAYDRALRRPWLRYALPAQALVRLSRNPALRRGAIRAAGAAGLFPSLLGLVR